MYMWICLCVNNVNMSPVPAREDIRYSGPGFQAVVSCLMWVLGTDPGSFGRAVVPLATVISAASVKGAFMQIWRTC